MGKQPFTILIVDDDEDVLLSAKLLLKKVYEKVIIKSDPKALNTILTTENIDVVVLDMNYRIGFNDGKEGVYWLKHVLEIKPEMVVILMTAYGEVELAVNTIKLGAFDFILKPWSNEKFLATIHAASQLSISRKSNAILKHTAKVIQELVPHGQETIIGSSKNMQSLYDRVDKVAKTDANVLILGENGTGKQHVAKRIHQKSDRKNGPFIHLDLGSLPESLFESELFGHKKGAFTDAFEDKPGRFELAENGTLFLDEIGNLPFHLQSKLLTVIQERVVFRIGDRNHQSVNARLVFATNAPLLQWVKEGKFREDLLFRINTIEIPIPPLRERKEDIKPLSKHFFKKFASKYNKPNLVMPEDTINELKKYNWPGNIRQLEHTIERGVIMTDSNEMSVLDLNLKPNDTSIIKSKESESLNIKELERNLIQKALNKHQGNISKAAKELGLTRAALYRRLEKFNI
ncbi:MAG: sigma-54-dependent Fis family transcriptional regulator [Bacteroidetes bacterium MedPE-SWsnd-G2]|nr:MAG: sigma-54-dependent Fis family transcriptional regulator [Bacteroidetes bacterium MedPE-SWsnd-G2]